MITYIWRTLFQRKVRTGLSMLGVSVSVAGVIALVSVAHGLRGSLDHYMRASGASLTVFSRDAADLAFSSVTDADVARIRALEGVDAVARANFSMIMAPKLGDRKASLPVIFCFGRLPGERVMQKYEPALTAGRLPETRAEILAGSFVAERLGLAVGDRIPLFGETYFGIEAYEVAGIYNSDVAWENGGIVVHAEVIAEQLGRPSYPLVFVYTAPEARDDVRARLEKSLDHLVAMPAEEFTDRFAAQAQIVDQFILVITVIALVVGVLGVLNTMMMSVAERTREIGTLRAVGWSRRRVMGTVLVEGVLLSSIGGAIGLGMGVAGTEVLLRIMPEAYLIADYRAATFGQGALVGLGVGVLAALYPAQRAASLRPVEALRYE